MLRAFEAFDGFFLSVPYLTTRPCLTLYQCLNDTLVSAKPERKTHKKANRQAKEAFNVTHHVTHWPIQAALLLS